MKSKKWRDQQAEVYSLLVWTVKARFPFFCFSSLRRIFTIIYLEIMNFQTQGRKCPRLSC
jgi:hypothetical protein